MGRAVRIVVADDHPLVREGARALIESIDGLEFLGEAANGAEAISVAAVMSPDVVLMDLHMPVVDGIEATRVITTSSRIAVLVVSMLDDDASASPRCRPAPGDTYSRERLPRTSNGQSVQWIAGTPCSVQESLSGSSAPSPPPLGWILK